MSQAVHGDDEGGVCCVVKENVHTLSPRARRIRSAAASSILLLPMLGMSIRELGFVQKSL